MKKHHYGFTVLEFLVVLAIILILVALILPSLNKTREVSQDEKKITDIKTIVLGLEQYNQICGFYPSQIDAEGCSNMPSGITLANFIPNLSEFATLFNNPSESKYYYTPTASGNFDDCTGFHIGVELINDVSGNLAAGDSNVNSLEEVMICQRGRFGGFNGQEPKVFDIYH